MLIAKKKLQVTVDQISEYHGHVKQNIIDVFHDIAFECETFELKISDFRIINEHSTVDFSEQVLALENFSDLIHKFMDILEKLEMEFRSAAVNAIRSCENKRAELKHIHRPI